MSRRLWVLAAAFAASVSLAEIALRIAGVAVPGYTPFPDEQLRGLVVPHPTRGYALQPGFHGEIQRCGRTIRVRVNARGQIGDELRADATRVVLAVGDSMTEGWGVQPEETWPARLEALLVQGAAPDVGVVNAGVCGYSARQMRATVEELIPVYRPRCVIMGVFVLGADRVENPYEELGGYIVRSSESRHLTVAGEGFFQSPFTTPVWKELDCVLARTTRFGSLVLRAFAPPREASEDASCGRVRQRERLLRKQLEPLLAELDLMQERTERCGIELIAMLVCVQETDGSFETAHQTEMIGMVALHCQEHGIRCLDMLPVLRRAAKSKPVFRQGVDFHWSPAAHELAAKQLVAVVRR